MSEKKSVNKLRKYWKVFRDKNHPDNVSEVTQGTSGNTDPTTHKEKNMKNNNQFFADAVRIDPAQAEARATEAKAKAEAKVHNQGYDEVARAWGKPHLVVTVYAEVIGIDDVEGKPIYRMSGSGRLGYAKPFPGSDEVNVFGRFGVSEIADTRWNSVLKGYYLWATLDDGISRLVYQRRAGSKAGIQIHIWLPEVDGKIKVPFVHENVEGQDRVLKQRAGKKADIFYTKLAADVCRYRIVEQDIQSGKSNPDWVQPFSVRNGVDLDQLLSGLTDKPAAPLTPEAQMASRKAAKMAQELEALAQQAGIAPEVVTMAQEILGTQKSSQDFDGNSPSGL